MKIKIKLTFENNMDKFRLTSYNFFTVKENKFEFELEFYQAEDYIAKLIKEVEKLKIEIAVEISDPYSNDDWSLTMVSFILNDKLFLIHQHIDKDKIIEYDYSTAKYIRKSKLEQINFPEISMSADNLYQNSWYIKSKYK
jgi:hypothetical protein